MMDKRRQAFSLLLEEAKMELAECDINLRNLRQQAGDLLHHRDQLMSTIEVITRLTKKGK